MMRGALGALALASCVSTFDPASYVTGLRVLAVKAEPPELASGASAVATALAVDTGGQMIALAWAVCLDPPTPAAPDVNPDCLLNRSAPYLTPIGSGETVRVTMPTVQLTQLGQLDATDGLYVPVVLRAAAGASEVDAVYRLRYTLPFGLPPNHNPTLDGVVQVNGGEDAPAPDMGLPGVVVPLDPATPMPVRSGDELTLRATFAAGSAETYLVLNGDPSSRAPTQVTEKLRVSWYATAGSFLHETTGEEAPDNVFTVDKHLPPAGSPIDLWVVATDERGGTDWKHYQLCFACGDDAGATD